MTGLRPVDPATARAYRLSLYRAGGLSVRTGRRPVPDDDAGAWWRRGDILFISASNPGGGRRPDGWNHRMMRHLAASLPGVTLHAGEGRLGRWSEPLFAVALPLARGQVVARRFRQNAILLVRNGRPARLLFLAPVLTPRSG
ncbi:conserved hypothetical protein [Gluconacetobacter diazotrophicus PA1 5]|uniref:DUF3293 domain-containing protein n=1 Tax=Gluconacetobacter diazotrophicus TaxID=33996 RepID=A0A7W4I3E6_GLUDI|nr:DUF3293 domain-containing protein [Gluconacetobacter diazotrophicus]ACI50370.1 conserved hypothetical protein [Gluconacetobacter diazotrophicus PA1 5]MBB2154711.1 DUF3293 domain-containing protein [Gluconacetobacter diazotrophicus]TWB08335.1 uncharacterized protein DUF3293 [Gluconacetobacter diazotrophicus]